MAASLRQQFPHALIITVDVDGCERTEITNLADLSIGICMIAGTGGSWSIVVSHWVMIGYRVADSLRVARITTVLN